MGRTNPHLQKLEKLAEAKAQSIEAAMYDKYYDLFKIAIKVLQKSRTLLYGGMAINEILPESLKIYKPKTLPDIDIFCTNGKQIAKLLISEYKRQNYQLASVTEALHENTLKLYVQGIQVADITTISNAAFKRLSKDSVIGPLGLRIVNPQFLRMSLHLMLSHSYDAHRWKKVYQRVIAFNKTYPPKVCEPAKILEEDEGDDEYADSYFTARDAIYKYVKKNSMVLFGAKEVHDMLYNTSKDAKIRLYAKIPHIQVLTTQNVEDVADDLVKLLPSNIAKYITMSSVYEGDGVLMGAHVFIKYKNTRWVGIYHAESCMSYNEYQGYRVATIHTILSMYLSMVLSPITHFEPMLDSLECMINALSLLQLKKVNSRRHLLQQFVLDCYGIQQGVATLRRERLMRILN